VAQLIVLMHAPALGPASWRPAAGELTRSGQAVAVPSLDGFTRGGPPYAPRLIGLCADQIRAAAGQLPEGRPDRIVLVPHSGAGVLARHVAAAAAASDVVIVYADAGLPGRAGPDRVADAEFLPHLQEIASNGVVPPWPQWWPGEDLSGLFPGEAARAAVLAEARPLPLAFFVEVLPPLPPGRPPGAAAYLLFSAGYRQEAAEARRRGWPVTELPGEHLHMLASPAGVAAAITALAVRAAGQGRG
jgi:hypothetical protein